MSRPSGPSRPATRRAWPPPPNVQSTATSPGCGSRSSISSPARTGTWVAVMSSRMAKAGGDVGKLVGEGGVVVGPGAALGVERVGGEVAVELARGLRQRVEPGERGGHVLVERLRRPHLYAALDALGQHDALTERGPELGRDREPVLGVEGVVEGAAEGHRSSRVTPARARARPRRL